MHAYAMSKDGSPVISRSKHIYASWGAFAWLDFKPLQWVPFQKEKEGCGCDLEEELQVSLEKGDGVAPVWFSSSSSFLHYVYKLFGK